MEQELTVLLSRIQFAMALTYHIIFPTINIGLAILICAFEGLYLKTNEPAYYNLTRFFTKVFALAFGVGVVSGITLSFMFGTNFNKFSLITGNIIGPLLSYEVLTAFFLEATFLGIMIFGWKKVSKKVHFMSSLTVCVGTIISAFWILSANSWMHTPQGFVFDDKGIMHVDSWMEIIFNPSFPYRFFHMITASILSASLISAAICAYNILRKHSFDEAKRGLRISIKFLFVFAPLQLFIGDLHGLNTLKHQPMKVAAMEGKWETEKGASFLVFAVPDSENEKNHFEIGIPKAASWILTHDANGEVKGLKEVKKQDRPPVGIVFYSFRIMLACGFLMIALGLYGYYLIRKNEDYKNNLLLKTLVFSGPIGIIATITGWFVAECGRQPWLVQNVLRTADGATVLNPTKVMFSITFLSFVYTLIFVAFIYYLSKVIKGGLDVNFVVQHPENEDTITHWLDTSKE